MRYDKCLALVVGLMALCAAAVGVPGQARAASGDWLVLRPSLAVAAPSAPSRRAGRLSDKLRSGLPARLIERETPSYGGPVSVQVSLGAQAMTVSVGGEVLYRWAISSGRIGYSTPHGTYHPQRLATMWRSRKYHMSPMPYSIFFRGGYAIHGTYATAYLGARASHGCIRLSPGNAATLFSLVRGAGFGRTRITISG